MDVIGFLGRDAEVKVHGTESVVNFSIAHTDKYKDGSGVLHEKTTWVSCSKWVENTNIAQYMKKGSLVYVSGFPEAKSWKNKNGEQQPYLNLRVINIQLLSSKKEDNSNQQAPQSTTPTQKEQPKEQGYIPLSGVIDSIGDDELPF